MNKLLLTTLTTVMLVTPGLVAANTIDADLDFSNGGTLNINQVVTLNDGKTITLGSTATGTIDSNCTLTNKGTIRYNPSGNAENGYKGVFNGGTISQNYDSTEGKVPENSIYINANIRYSVYNGSILDPLSGSNTLSLAGRNLTQKFLIDRYYGGKLDPNLAGEELSQITYTDDEGTYDFKVSSKEHGALDRLELGTGNGDGVPNRAKLQNYLTEFGIGVNSILSAEGRNGNSRIEALAASTENDAVLIPDTLKDASNIIRIPMATTSEEGPEIQGNLHSTGQSNGTNQTLRLYIANSASATSPITLSGNNSKLLTDVEFQTKSVKFKNTNSIPGGVTTCRCPIMGIVVGEGENKKVPTVPSGATLNILGGSISGELACASGGTIRIGAPRQ